MYHSRRARGAGGAARIKRGRRALARIRRANIRARHSRVRRRLECVHCLESSIERDARRYVETDDEDASLAPGRARGRRTRSRGYHVYGTR